ncbi:MAG TPA: amidase [Gaiellaceae bacterium]|nr:amidase [Gaiellaceae bacterium]
MTTGGGAGAARSGPAAPAPAAARPSARAWLRRLEAREVSSRELVEDALARLDRAAALGAVAARDDEAALAAADEADRARAAGSAAPLLGLPLTIKDSLETAGLRTASGSHARAGHVPTADATVVARVRAAGAVVAAKTTVPEYTWSYETESDLHGRTLNPFDLERTCGGSSGGEAALLAADASLAGIGTDGGGSIRLPAHYCGVVGHRPTAGLVPETGAWPPTRTTGMLDLNAVGPLARFVEDLTLLLPLLAGADGIDPFVHGAALGDPDAVEVAGLRVGVVAADGALRMGPATELALGEAGEALAGLGCAVEPAAFPEAAEATELFFALMAADGGAQARADLAPAAGRHAPELVRLLEDLRPNAVDAEGFFALLRRLAAVRARVRAFLGGFDAVLLPVAPGPAPPHGGVPGAELGLDGYEAHAATQALSLAAVPITVVRVGWDGQLPLGVQVAAPAGRDHVSLAVAAALESALGPYAGPPAPLAAGRAA